MPDFKAAIFDLDGTLIDSMGVWEKIDHDFLLKRGIAVPETYVHDITHLSFGEAAEYTIKLFGLSETAEAIIAEWNAMAVDEYSHHIMLKPHAQRYLLHLKKDRIKLGVATSLPKILYEPVLINNDIRHLFETVASTDEIGRGKEFPDVFLRVSHDLGVRPEECIVFDDILPALQSAKNVGMTVYGVYDRYSAGEQEAIRKIADGYIMGFSEMFK